MRHYKILVAILLWLMGCGAASAQDETLNKQLAQRMVRSASVKPGDVVIIEGGKHMVPLIEDIAIEVAMAGGLPNIFYDSDRLTRAVNKDVPERYLEQEPRYIAEWLRHTDVYISLPGTDDPKALIEGVPQERFAKMNKAGHFFGDMLNSLPIRVVSLDYPVKGDAEVAGMDLAEYQKLMFQGINTDYETVSQSGIKLQGILRSGKQVHVTTPAGTDLVFTIAPGRDVFLDDGIVTAEEAKSTRFTDRFAVLPGGSIFLAPLEASANGKVIVPRTSCRYQPFDKATFDLKDGKMVNFNAASNQACYDETFKGNSGQWDILGGVLIGLNPGLRVVETGKANLRNTRTAGLVSIDFGGNKLYGGTLDSIGGPGFTLTNATVTVDGKTIIKDGKLVF